MTMSTDKLMFDVDNWYIVKFSCLRFINESLLKNWSEEMAENIQIDLSGEINANTEKKGLQKYVNEMEL